jgi:hypothetical protein
MARQIISVGGIYITYTYLWNSIWKYSLPCKFETPCMGDHWLVVTMYRTAGTGQPGQDEYGETAMTGQSGQVEQDS